MAGKVVIIGAGPGPADLLAVRAVEALRRAQVVLHDDLVSKDVLALCSQSAQLINMGKRCGKRGTTQEHINALMVQHARQGSYVARLKSGDPAVFGRLGEELEALREAEIHFEIIPGITAAAAAAAATEMTLTDRRSASALVILTAHNAGREMKQRAILDFERTTFAIYMPGPDYGRTARDLMNNGIDGSTPCAVVSNACRDNQQIRFMSIADLRSAREIVAPAVLIVGNVAASSKFPSFVREPYRLEEAAAQLAADLVANFPIL
jgi:uroporphyrin-III C-methyltransferase